MVMRSKQPSSIRSSDKVDSRTIWRSATVSKVFVDDSLKKDKFWAFKIDMNLGFRVRNRIVLFWFGDGANGIPWLIRPQKLLSKDVGRKFTLQWLPFDHPWPCDKISDFSWFKFSNRFFHCKKFLKNVKLKKLTQWALHWNRTTNRSEKYENQGIDHWLEPRQSFHHSTY